MAAVNINATSSPANTAAQMLMLRKAMDTQAAMTLELLNNLPQKDGVGQIIDFQA